MELSPEEWRGWEVFDSLWSQWRVIVGWGGIEYQGIDYPSVKSVMCLFGVRKKHRRNVFWMVRVMEEEARTLRNQR